MGALNFKRQATLKFDSQIQFLFLQIEKTLQTTATLQT